MAKATLELFPYVYLNKDGKFLYAGAHNWRYVDKGDCPEGRIDTDSGNITVFLPSFKVDFTHPDDVREQALHILRFHRDKLTAEHVKTMTNFQWTEGMLLGLAAPEVLDAAEVVRQPDRDYEGDVEEAVIRPPRSTDDGDIPF